MRLKKNNVCIDIVNFANPANVPLLEGLVSCANSGSDDEPNSHFLDIPEGLGTIMDVLVTSPILASEPGEGAQETELEMALRLSREEANAAANQN